MVLVPERSSAAKPHRAQAVAIAAATPAPMKPGTHYYFIECGCRVVGFNGFVEVPGAKAVFGIKVATHHQHSGFQLTHYLAGVASLPPGIVHRLHHQIVPESNAVAKVVSVEIG